MKLVSLKNVSKSYGDKKKISALQGFDFSIQDGEMVALMGKSGSGKSTALNIISGIDSLEKGSYFFRDRDMGKLAGDQMTKFRRDHIGFVLQHFALIPSYTIYDNIAFPLRLRHEKRKRVDEKVKRVAGQLEIAKHLSRYPRELSGGEAQRAAVARAVVHDPELILADEPTGALDEENGLKVMEIFRQLNQQGKTFIIVTHDPNIAQMCGRTVRIRDGKNIK